MPGLVRRCRRVEARIAVGTDRWESLGTFCCQHAAALATLAEYKRRKLVLRRGPWRGRLPTEAEIRQLVRPCCNCSCS